jgi:hypothetical protein
LPNQTFAALFPDVCASQRGAGAGVSAAQRAASIRPSASIASSVRLT